MGTITINLNDGLEQSFRETVREELGVGKGKLGTAVQQALTAWIKEKKHYEISQRQIQLMKKGFKLGKYTFNRDELHDRKY